MTKRSIYPHETVKHFSFPFNFKNWIVKSKVTIFLVSTFMESFFMAIKWKENQLIKQVPNLKNHFIGFLTRILSQVLLLVMTAFRHSHYFFSQACNESCVCVWVLTHTLSHMQTFGMVSDGVISVHLLKMFYVKHVIHYTGAVLRNGFCICYSLTVKLHAFKECIISVKTTCAAVAAFSIFNNVS